VGESDLAGLSAEKLDLIRRMLGPIGLPGPDRL
jgi:hypothetical protein